MYPIERQNEILNILKARKSVSVTELSKQLYISEATIRRDLEKLERKNLLKRTYGGAVLIEGLDREIPLSIRETVERDAKERIGEMAAGLVKPGDTIILDSSSTTLRMVPYLKNIENLRVITNGVKTALELGNLGNAKVYSTGGLLRENSLSFIGEHARKCVKGFYVDTLFFSCRGLSMEKGLTDSIEEEAILRRLMLKSCRKSVLLCDHSKFNKISFSYITDIEGINAIVTDSQPSAEWMLYLERHGVELLYIHNEEKDMTF